MTPLKRLTVFSFFLVLAASCLSAQVMYDPFLRPGNPTGWDQPVGSWTVVDLGGYDLWAESGGNSHSNLTRTAAVASMGAIELKARPVSLACSGGAVLRYDAAKQVGVSAYGTSTGAQYRYKKLVLLVPGGPTTTIVLGQETRELRVRLLVQGSEARAQFDVYPLDGAFDHEMTVTGATNASLPGVFGSFRGYLDGNGKATARLVVPNIGPLAGISVFISGVVLDNQVPPSLIHLFNDERIELRT